MPEECTHDCSTCGADCGSREGSIKKASLHPGCKVKKVIAVVSGKGGVGKSLVTSLLAVDAKRRGFKSAVLDADITGPSIPKAFGITGKAEGTEEYIYPRMSEGGIPVMSVNLLMDDPSDPVIWRGPVIAGVVTQFWSDVLWEEIDYMFVDMPPGTGDVPLTVFQSLPVDGIVVVTSPQSLVSEVVAKAVKMAQLMEIPILGLVENMSYVACPDCGRQIKIFGDSHVEETAGKYGLDVLARMPIDPQLAALCDAGKIEECPQESIPAVDKIFAL